VAELILYSYFRSSAVFRVRIALNLKGLRYQLRPIHLKRQGGENWGTEYLAINPQGLVPVLSDSRRVFNQSLAIIEYLEDLYPEPPLLPASPRDRAQVRALAQMVTSDIHPLNNLRVLDYLKDHLHSSVPQRHAWYCHWIHEGFKAIETILDRNPATGMFCHGDQPGLADVCLVPQVYNARRYGCDLSAYPTICRIDQHCRSMEAFKHAAPENQPDAE